MRLIGTTFDVIGALGTAIGAIGLMNQGYAALVSTRAAGRVTAWALEDGETDRYRATLAYTDATGAAREATSTELASTAERDARPVGTPVALRYRTREPEYAAIDEGFFSTWGSMLVALAIGIAGFAIGARFG